MKKSEESSNYIETFLRVSPYRMALEYVSKLLIFGKKNRSFNNLNDGKDLLKRRVISSDERWIYTYDVWSSVKCDGCLPSQCRGPSWVLPRGGTVSKEYYVKLMRRLRELIQEKRSDLWQNNSWLLYRDIVSAWTWYFDILGKKGTVIIYKPSFSPDLAPYDFFRFRKLKTFVKRWRFLTVGVLKTGSQKSHFFL